MDVTSLCEGSVVDRYTVEGLIGEGGMAMVFRVRHNVLGTHHALKVLTVASKSIRDRAGARRPPAGLPAAPEHRGRSTDVVDLGGTPGLVLELVEGPNLDAVIRAQRLTIEEIDALVPGILAATAARARPGLRPPRSQAREHPARPHRDGPDAEGRRLRAREDRRDLERNGRGGRGPDRRWEPPSTCPPSRSATRAASARPPTSSRSAPSCTSSSPACAPSSAPTCSPSSTPSPPPTTVRSASCSPTHPIGWSRPSRRPWRPSPTIGPRSRPLAEIWGGRPRGDPRGLPRAVRPARARPDRRGRSRWTATRRAPPRPSAWTI